MDFGGRVQVDELSAFVLHFDGSFGVVRSVVRECASDVDVCSRSCRAHDAISEVGV